MESAKYESPRAPPCIIPPEPEEAFSNLNIIDASVSAEASIFARPSRISISKSRPALMISSVKAFSFIHSVLHVWFRTNFSKLRVFNIDSCQPIALSPDGLSYIHQPLV